MNPLIKMIKIHILFELWGNIPWISSKDDEEVEMLQAAILLF